MMITTSKLGTTESSIYRDLATHQTTEEWFGRSMIETLQVWAERFVVEFKLDISEISIRIDVLPNRRFGQFRFGHNGFGLKGEIALNSRYLDRELWAVLGTLLHELLHAWQETHGIPGKRNHHNAEFCEKARTLGLVIDKRGITAYAADSAFKELLRQFGIAVPQGEIPPQGGTLAGRSKLKKWTCGCINLWCAKGELDARCMKCGERFELVTAGVRRKRNLVIECLPPGVAAMDAN